MYSFKPIPCGQSTTANTYLQPRQGIGTPSKYETLALFGHCHCPVKDGDTASERYSLFLLMALTTQPKKLTTQPRTIAVRKTHLPLSSVGSH